MYEYVTGYRDDAELAGMFFDIARDTFGLDLKGWAARGNWGDTYVCHSLIEDGRMAANVSTTFMTMLINGEPREVMQIGTVCTRPEYRRRGYAALLMRKAIDSANGRGIFLFANPDAVGFYEKLGLKHAPQECLPVLTFPSGAPINEDDVFSATQYAASAPVAPYMFRKATPAQAMEYVRRNNVYSNKFDVKTIPDLAALYIEDFYKDTLYVADEPDICLSAEYDEGALVIHAIYAEKICAPARLLESLRLTGAEKIIFEFMPDAWGLPCEYTPNGPDETFTLNLTLPQAVSYPGVMRA